MSSFHSFPSEIKFYVTPTFSTTTNSYINIANYSFDIHNLLDSNEIVAPRKIRIIFDFPFSINFVLSFKSKSRSGFTRSELLQKISKTYFHLYSSNYKSVESLGLISGVGDITVNDLGIWGYQLHDLNLISVKMITAFSNPIYRLNFKTI